MDSIPHAPGVYQILCIPTGKIYIGSGVDLRRRWQHHRDELCRRYGRQHHNRYLQNAWDKYGESAFRFEVLELTSPDQLLVVEQRWMDATRCYERDRGYNIRTVAESDLGVKRSDAARQRMSAALSGVTRGPLSPAHRAKLSAIRQGIVFSETTKERMRESAKRRGAPNNAKEWIVTSPDGQEMHIVDLHRFCRKNNLVYKSMHGVARGRQQQHRGWRCRLA